MAAGSRMIERKHGGAAVREGGERMPEVVRRAGGIPTNPSHAGCTSHTRPGQDGPGLRGRCTDAARCQAGLLLYQLFCSSWTKHVHVGLLRECMYSETMSWHACRLSAPQYLSGEPEALVLFDPDTSLSVHPLHRSRLTANSLIPPSETFVMECRALDVEETFS